MQKINVTDTASLRARTDLLCVYYNSKMYINEKGYLTKLIDILYKLGYYEDNESILNYVKE